MLDFSEVQRCAVEIIDGTEALLVDMENSKLMLDRDHLHLMSLNKYLTKELGKTFARWWINEYFIVTPADGSKKEIPIKITDLATLSDSKENFIKWIEPSEEDSVNAPYWSLARRRT